MHRTYICVPWRLWTPGGRTQEDRFLGLVLEHIQKGSDVRSDSFGTLTELRRTCFQFWDQVRGQEWGNEPVSSGEWHLSSFSEQYLGDTWFPFWLPIQGAGKAIRLSAVTWLLLSLSISRRSQKKFTIVGFGMWALIHRAWSWGCVCVCSHPFTWLSLNNSTTFSAGF